MTAGKRDLIFEKGATYDKTFTWKNSVGVPYDLTGYTAIMHVREKKEDADFKIDLATSNGRIELGGVDGTIRLIISAATTTAIDWQTGVYDLQLIIGSDVKRFIEGSIHVSYGVTR